MRNAQQKEAFLKWLDMTIEWTPVIKEIIASHPETRWLLSVAYQAGIEEMHNRIGEAVRLSTDSGGDSDIKL